MGKGLSVTQQNQDLCSPYMGVIMLLDSRMGRSQFRNHKKTAWNASIYSLKDLSGVNARCTQKILKTTPFALAINATKALFSVKKILE